MSLQLIGGQLKQIPFENLMFFGRAVFLYYNKSSFLIRFIVQATRVVHSVVLTYL